MSLLLGICLRLTGMMMMMRIINSVNILGENPNNKHKSCFQRTTCQNIIYTINSRLISDRKIRSSIVEMKMIWITRRRFYFLSSPILSLQIFWETIHCGPIHKAYAGRRHQQQNRAVKIFCLQNNTNEYLSPDLSMELSVLFLGRRTLL